MIKAEMCVFMYITMLYKAIDEYDRYDKYIQKDTYT